MGLLDYTCQDSETTPISVFICHFRHHMGDHEMPEIESVVPVYKANDPVC